MSDHASETTEFTAQLDDDFLTPDQVMDAMGGGISSPRTLANWRYRGIGPKFYKMGRRVLYRRRDVAAYIERRAHDPEAALTATTH